MPNLDGKGPQGKGPMTGRGMGNCEEAEKENANIGRGAGRGMGRPCRRGFFGRRRNNVTESEQ